jgi:hypothetical protein
VAPGCNYSWDAALFLLVYLNNSDHLSPASPASQFAGRALITPPTIYRGARIIIIKLKTEKKAVEEAHLREIPLSRGRKRVNWRLGVIIWGAGSRWSFLSFALTLSSARLLSVCHNFGERCFVELFTLALLFVLILKKRRRVTLVGEAGPGYRKLYGNAFSINFRGFFTQSKLLFCAGPFCIRDILVEAL